MGGLAVTGTMAPALVPTATAVIVHTLGSACMLASLTFGVTVVPWAAEHTVRHAKPPEIFSALSGWTSSLYLVHMLCSYATFALLGAALLIAPDAPTWLGWLGIGLGLNLSTGLVVTRFAGPFNPPILAHTYTAIIGIVLLAT